MSQNPLLAADALAEGAALAHGPEFHTRGGGVGRARSEQAKGAGRSAAARTAARQAKGHAAELSLATQFTARAALAGLDAVARPNSVANDTHIDVEVVEQAARVNGAQVGVGTPRYLAQKARKSAAPQVVINLEARKQLARLDPEAFQLTSERMTHRQLTTSEVSEAVAFDQAVEAIERALSPDPRVGFLTQAGLAVGAGAQSAVVGGCSSLVFELVERVFAGKSIDRTVIEVAFASGARSFVTTTLQTYSQVSLYFTHARETFRARLLHIIASNAAWAGAVADFVVTTSRDVLRWVRNEIDFAELLRRAGVTAFAVAGTALAVTATTRIFAGAPWWAQLFLVGGAAIGGGKLGRYIGESLLTPPPQILAAGARCH